MMNIERFEQVLAQGKKDETINSTLLWAYRDSKEAGNDRINFGEVIWDYDIEPILEGLKAEGITEFTISSTFSSLIETLAAFDKLGCRMAGLAQVKTRYTDWQTGEHALIPAIRMSL
ncbi:MAG: hypothetical protein VB082_06300 [Christensenella sp.]|nr:hypothetical protein [Christensenella sp.]